MLRKPRACSIARLSGRAYPWNAKHLRTSIDEPHALPGATPRAEHLCSFGHLIGVCCWPTGCIMAYRTARIQEAVQTRSMLPLVQHGSTFGVGKATLVENHKAAAEPQLIRGWPKSSLSSTWRPTGRWERCHLQLMVGCVLKIQMAVTTVNTTNLVVDCGRGGA